jgi:hypothetical protein
MGNLEKHGKPWSEAEETVLRELVLARVSKAYISARLGRTSHAINNKLVDLTRRSKGRVSPYAIRRDQPRLPMLASQGPN